MLHNHCKEKGSFVNTVLDLNAAWEAQPRLGFATSSPVCAAQIAASPVYAGLTRWLEKQKAKDATHVSCGLEKPSYAKAFSDKLIHNLPIEEDKLFRRMASATHEDMLKQHTKMIQQLKCTYK